MTCPPHEPGGKLYRYVRHAPEVSQHPARRPVTAFEEVGYECAKCGKRVERPRKRPAAVHGRRDP